MRISKKSFYIPVEQISDTRNVFLLKSYIISIVKLHVQFIIPSPTKLRRDIVTLPSVRPSVLPSFSPSVLSQHPCEHSRINILQWILTKLGTYLVLKRIWNPIDFQGQRSRSPGQIIYRITSL